MSKDVWNGLTLLNYIWANDFSMDKSSIIENATIIILFISLLLAFFLLTVKTTNRQANKFLGAYFLVFAVHISVFFYSKYIILSPVMEVLRDHIAFFTSPLLFLYVIASIYSDFQLKPKHILHIIPFIIVMLIFTPRFYFVTETKRLDFLENFNSTIESKLSIIFGLLVPLFYLIISFLELKKYKKIVLENYSNKKIFNYKWLLQLVILLSIIYGFSLAKQVYKLIGTDIEVLNLLRLILTLVLILFLTWIVLKNMYHPKLFRNIDLKHQLLKDEIDKKSLLENKDFIPHKKKIERLKKYMEEEEPYLNASLTLNKLAEGLNISSRELSFLINHNFNKHFFDFINEYRINKAKFLLENTSKNELTIQQIMYDIGFNSKSSFYTEFKKFTSQTPTQYKDNYFSNAIDK